MMAMLRMASMPWPVLGAIGDAPGIAWADPVAALVPYGIRVPEDVIVISDNHYLHLRIDLDESSA